MDGSDLPVPADRPGAVVDVLIPVAVDQAYSYRVPEGLVLSPGDVVSVPLGTRQTHGVVWEVSHPASGGGNLKAVLGPRSLPPVRQPLRDLIDWVARWTLMPRGMVLRMAIRAPEFGGPDAERFGYRPTQAVVPDRLTPARARILDALRTGPSLPGKAALAHTAGCSVGVIDGLISLGLVEAAPIPPEPAALPPDPHRPGPTLSPAQSEAAEGLRAAVMARRFGVTLLDGVTGSGKTDVYFEAVAAALAAGRQVLILLPEIALTAQFLDRFRARFGVLPGEWHSEVGSRRRAKLWSAVANGEARVVAGARSSLFLPFADLGLIVVDEEHDPAYKQEDGVAYHARDMAVVRGRLEDAPVVLASATPSVETRVNADRGRYGRLALPHRFGGRPMPDLRAIDLRAESPPRGEWITPRLLEAVRATVARGEQALLFLNRRGYAPLTLCRRCGHRFRCPHCAAWLVEHRFRGAIVCHHCGHSEPKPRTCPECEAADSLVACGPGVERLAENVVRDLPDARVLVLSSDMPGGLARMREELAAVASGAVDVVIGTQLVAKGHDFPHLTLVGVIDADVGLANGDPRAAERTFQILQQVTGRAGRGGLPGTGLIQTYQPDHPVLRALLSGDTERFYASEIAARQDADLPPFGKLAAVIVSGTDRQAAEAHARALARAASAQAAAASHEAGDALLLVLGPAEAPLAVLRGRYRFRLLVKSARRVDLQAFLRDTLRAAPKPRGSVEVHVDVDPQSFL